MADIESDWDDAVRSKGGKGREKLIYLQKDGKPPSKQRTATKDIPTADTPSARVAKIPDFNEKVRRDHLRVIYPPLPL